MIDDNELQTGRFVVFRYGFRHYWVGKIGSPRYYKSKERLRLAKPARHRSYVDVAEVLTVHDSEAAAERLAAQLAETHRKCDAEAYDRLQSAIEQCLKAFGR